MKSDRALRAALWASVVLNALGVIAFMPLAVGRPSPFLPLDVSAFLAAQVAFTIALFGGRGWHGSPASIGHFSLLVGWENWVFLCSQLPTPSLTRCRPALPLAHYPIWHLPWCFSRHHAKSYPRSSNRAMS